MLKKYSVIFILIGMMLIAKNVYAFDYKGISTSVDITKEPILNARAAIVIDRNTGLVLYEKNSNDVRKMASTTKIMTAIVVLENMNDLYETVTVSKKAASVRGSELGVKIGDTITINDLLYGLMLPSGNDAAIALAEHIGGTVEGFAILMNDKAKQLGLTKTNFVTPHGLDVKGHETTAYELAILTKYALENEKFREIVAVKYATVTISGRSKNIKNTNELLGNYSGMYGVKTGYTGEANRCIVSACKRENIDVIAVVLGADTKTLRGIDTKKMLEYVYNNFKTIDIESEIKSCFEDWENDTFITIKKGKSKYLELKLGKIKYSQLNVNKNILNNRNISIIVKDNFLAPIYIDEKIGEMIIEVNGKEFFRVDILAKEAIKEKDVLDYIKDIVKVFKIKLLQDV